MYNFRNIKEDDLTFEDLADIETLLLRAWEQKNPKREYIFISFPRDDPEARRGILKHILKVHSGKEYEEYCNRRMCRLDENNQKNL